MPNIVFLIYDKNTKKPIAATTKIPDTKKYPTTEFYIEVCPLLSEEKEKKLPICSSPSKIVKLLLQHISENENVCEKTSVFLFDSDMRFLKVVDIALGGINECHIPRSRFAKEILSVPTKFVITAHNHPSNNVTPSRSDKKMWQELSKVCTMLGDVMLVNNYIYSKKEIYSQMESKTYDI